MNNNIYIYILVMAVTTYLIRALPLTIIRRDIKNEFIRSFLYYVPYATLAAMVFPAILTSTSSILSAVMGFAAALFMAYREKSLLTVALSACGIVFIVEQCISILSRSI